MNQLEPIRLSRASTVVAERLRAEILSGTLANTERLPPEPDVAAHLGISRHHLREALRLLEQDGLVEIRRGHTGGIFLAVPRPEGLARTFETAVARMDVSLADLFELSKTVWSAIAKQAATTLGDDDVAKLQALQDAWPETDEFVPELATQLRAIMTDAARSKTLQLIALAMEPHANAMERETAPAVTAGYGRYVRAMIAALKARDAKAAVRRMQHFSDYSTGALDASGFNTREHNLRDFVTSYGRSPQTPTAERSSRMDLQRASTIVAAELRRMILYGNIADGDRLAPEAELAGRLGISRHHLREALRLLEQDGIIEVRRGPYGGPFLTTPSDEGLARTFQGILARSQTPVEDLLTARALLEPPAARLAAQRVREDELCDLDAIIAKQEACESAVPELNVQFHLGVAAATHNRALHLVLRMMAPLFVDIDRAIGEAVSVEETIGAHRAILGSLERRDAGEAESLMSAHMRGAANRLRDIGIDPTQMTIAAMIERAVEARERRGSDL